MATTTIPTTHAQDLSDQRLCAALKELIILDNGGMLPPGGVVRQLASEMRTEFPSVDWSAILSMAKSAVREEAAYRYLARYE